MLQWRDAGPMTQDEAVQHAVDRLSRAGMIVRYSSAFGASWYLGWPGRSGTLRVSDHASTRRQACGIYARITFSEQKVVTMTDTMMLDMIASAFGRYMLLAPKGNGGAQPESCSVAGEERP